MCFQLLYFIDVNNKFFGLSVGVHVYKQLENSLGVYVYKQLVTFPLPLMGGR